MDNYLVCLVSLAKEILSINNCLLFVIWFELFFGFKESLDRIVGRDLFLIKDVNPSF